MRRRPGARRRDSTGPRKPWQCSRQARRQRPSASSSSTAVFYSPPCNISSSEFHTTPRNINSSSRRSISGSHRNINIGSSSSAAVRTPWPVGAIAVLFPLRPARTFLFRMSNDTFRTAKHVFPSAIHYPTGWSTRKLLYDFSWRLRFFFRMRMQTVNAHGAGPAWTVDTLRLILELLNRLGCNDPVLSPR